MASARRPEHQAPPDIFYNEQEARKYTSNSRIVEIQKQMSERAIELLALPEDASCFILDLGCGSGLSGETLEEQGHFWVGVDISQAMLDVSKERELEGDVVLGDMGQGLCFRAGMFDGAISISALQWLCNADQKCQSPAQRLYKFFTMLYSCLTRGSRAVFQFYPENNAQIQLITQQAMKAGFTGGLVIDYPNSTKAKKIFLVLFAGTVGKLPKALGTEASDAEPKHVPYNDKRDRQARLRQMRGKSVKNTREWILEKKERRRRQGKPVREDTKYTGRKRSGRF